MSSLVSYTTFETVGMLFGFFFTCALIKTQALGPPKVYARLCVGDEQRRGVKEG